MSLNFWDWVLQKATLFIFSQNHLYLKVESNGGVSMTGCTICTCGVHKLSWAAFGEGKFRQ